MDVNESKTQSVIEPKTKRRSNIWLIIVAALFIIVPFLTWYGTWFGRELSDEDIAKYLADEKSPRHIQHALLQIEARIEKHDPTVRKFYPQVIALTKNPVAEIRKTAAWVMGQDPSAEEFHRALLPLLNDPEPLVRRNAALQLVRFADPSGRAELRTMLQPFEVKSSMAGTIDSILPAGTKIKAGGLLARIRDASNTVLEFRSPLDGAISSLSTKEGETVTVGQPVAKLSPDQSTVLDALRGLAYVGTLEDLSVIEPLAQGTTNSDAEIRQQATLAMKAIQGRRGAPKTRLNTTQKRKGLKPGE
jgi:biotin carboxyl carrier protein